MTAGKLSEFIFREISLKDDNGAKLHWTIYQQDIFSIIDSIDDIIINKCGNMGITTIFSVYALYTAIYKPKSISVILSPNSQCEKEIILLTKTILDSIDANKVEVPNIISITDCEIIFDNNSIISTNYCGNNYEYGDENYFIHEDGRRRPCKITNYFVDEYGSFNIDRIFRVYMIHQMFLRSDKNIISSTHGISQPAHEDFWSWDRMWEKYGYGLENIHPINLAWCKRSSESKKCKSKVEFDRIKNINMWML